jgi:hypothetical protein
MVALLYQQKANQNQILGHVLVRATRPTISTKAVNTLISAVVVA